MPTAVCANFTTRDGAGADVDAAERAAERAAGRQHSGDAFEHAEIGVLVSVDFGHGKK